MADDAVLQLAKQLKEMGVSPGDMTYLRRGIVTAITGATVTITLGGATVTTVPYHRHVGLAVGDSVDLLFDGPTPRIIGVIGQSPAWVSVGSGGSAPAFENGWVNYGAGGYATAAYWKDAQNIVHLRGAVKNGTVPATIFTLPVGFRPSNGQLRFANYTYPPGAAGDLLIAPSGLVYLNAGGNQFVSLDGTSFHAA